MEDKFGNEALMSCCRPFKKLAHPIKNLYDHAQTAEEPTCTRTREATTLLADDLVKTMSRSYDTVFDRWPLCLSGGYLTKEHAHKTN
eukprot:4447960-Amphidinium_carterae.1